MKQLIHSEFIRLSRRPLYFIPISIVAFFVVLPIVFLLISRNSGAYSGYFQAYTGFPKGAMALFRVALFLLPVGVCILVAGSIGEDYASGYLKVALPRIGSRRRAIGAKLLALLLAATGIMVATFLLPTAAGAIGRVASSSPFIDAEIVPSQLVSLAGFMIVDSVYLVALSGFLATLMRSQGSGLVLSILAPYLMRPLTFLPGGTLLPAIHLDVVEMHLVPGSRFSPTELESVLGAAPSLQASLATLLIASVLLLGGTVWLFVHRDVR